MNPAAAQPATDQADKPAQRQHNPWFVLFTVCLGFFMILLDTTIVNIAIPDITRRLDASLDDILWILNAYIMVYAVLLITAGRLGDLHGPKRLFLIGLACFTLASVACGLAQNPGQLIVFRVVQGIGGALLTPQTLSVLTMIFPPQKRGAAFGIWGAVAGVATVAGPTIGGWLVTTFDWRWIFFVNLPIGIAALILATFVMPDLRLNRQHRLDPTGTVLVSIGLFLVTYGLIEGQPHDWGKVLGPITIPMVLAAGVVVLGLFGWQQYAQRDKEPLVPVAIFRDRNFSLMNGVAGALGFGMVGLFLPIVIYLQSVLGLSALQAGLTVAPMSLVSLCIAPFAGRLSDRLGGKYPLLTGLTLFAIGMGVLIASAHVGSSRLHLLPGLLVAGCGLGLTFAPLQTVAMREIQPAMAGAASGLINTARQLGAVLGSSAVGALLQSQLADKLRAAASEHAGQVPPQFREQVVRAVSSASAGGLEVGAGQTGVQVPPGIPEQAANAIRAFARLVFEEAFTNAMRMTLILPIAVLGAGVICCLFARGRRRAAPDQRTAPDQHGAIAPDQHGAQQPR